MDTTRQKDLINCDKLESFHVTVIGAGGIGSFASAALAKMGVGAMDIWDKDDLEAHNIPNQNYSMNQLGRPKVEALQERLDEDSDCMIEVHNDFFWGNQELNTDIIVSGVDSMTARKRIWDTLKENPQFKNNPIWYLDSRMGAQEMQLFVVHSQDPESIKDYEKSLFSDEKAAPEPCTARSIIFMPYECASVICQTVRRIVNNMQVKQFYYRNVDENIVSVSGKEISLR